MSDVRSEQKMQLVQQIRTQYEQNQYDIKNRKYLVYGNSFPTNTQNKITETATESQQSGTLKIRCAVAALLFLLVIIFDLTGVCPFGISTENIFASVAVDYQGNVTKLLETMGETVNMK